MLTQALRRTRDCLEKSLEETVATLQNDKALLAKDKLQLEEVLWHLCLHVRGSSKVAQLQPILQAVHLP